MALPLIEKILKMDREAFNKLSWYSRQEIELLYPEANPYLCPYVARYPIPDSSNADKFVYYYGETADTARQSLIEMFESTHPFPSLKGNKKLWYICIHEARFEPDKMEIWFENDQFCHQIQ